MYVISVCVCGGGGGRGVICSVCLLLYIIDLPITHMTGISVQYFFYSILVIGQFSFSLFFFSHYTGSKLTRNGPKRAYWM